MRAKRKIVVALFNEILWKGRISVIIHNRMVWLKATSLGICILLIAAVSLCGCGGNDQASDAGSTHKNDATSGISSISGMTPEDSGADRFDNPDAAMEEAGFFFVLPNEKDAGDFVVAYVGPDGMGHPGVSVWYENFKVTCYRTGDTPVDYASHAEYMHQLSLQGPNKDLEPFAWASEVNGCNGMVWSNASDMGKYADANANGPVDLFWIDGDYTFELNGETESFTESAARQVAKDIKITESKSSR